MESETAPPQRPIFILWTRSFLATIGGIVLIFFSADPAVLQSIGDAVSYVLPFVGDNLGETLIKLAPAALWAFAIHQRSGAARPYTLDPTALK